MNDQTHQPDASEPESAAELPSTQLPSSAHEEASADVVLPEASELNVPVDEQEDEPFSAPPATNRFELVDDSFDIDAALAAVATLSDGAAEREREADAAQAEADQQHPAILLPTPPTVTLKRGTPASLAPALILIAAGALLTTITTSGGNVPSEWVAFGVFGAVGLLLISYWLSARRWARGALFIALVLLLGSGVVYWMLQPGSVGSDGLPLLVATTGLALMLAAAISKPPMPKALWPGVLMIAGGTAAFATASGMVRIDFIGLAVQYAWLIPVILMVLWLLPLIRRRAE